MEENKQNQQQESGKVKKKFEESKRKLEAIMGNPTWFKQPKVGKAQLPALLERMALAKQEDLFKKFETAAGALIEEKLAYDKAVKQKEAEFNKAVEDKMKDFQVKMDALFALIDQIDGITSDYYGALTSIAEGKAPVVMGENQPGESTEGISPSL